MNLDAVIHGLLLRLRTINRAIEQFETLAEGQIASHMAKPPVEKTPDGHCGPFEPGSMSLQQ